MSAIATNADSKAGAIVAERGSRSPSRPFEPHPLFRNPHLATVAAACWPRGYANLPAAMDRLFEAEPGTRLLARCHWQEVPRRHATVVLVHGLEGSSESPYMLGIAERAFQAGFNVLRMNQRNCGGTEHLTPTLYNSGLSGDYQAVLEELIALDGLPEVFFCGYSIGGNLVLKMAGEFAEHAQGVLRGICAVSPCLDLASCAGGSGQPRNLLYESYFLRSMRNRMERKANLFPERYQAHRFSYPRTLHEWHEAITAPEFGYRSAANYYYQASALRVIGQIRVPTLILTAQDDPLVPIDSFSNPRIQMNPFITFEAPEHGGHCAFISSESGNARFWAEQRVVEFCAQHTELGKGRTIVLNQNPSRPAQAFAHVPCEEVVTF